MVVEFSLPDLGENIEAGDVLSLLVSEGDRIQPEQSVLELETEKAVIEVPCPHGGHIDKIHVQAGDRVSIGDRILTLTEGQGNGAGAAATGRQEPFDEEPSSPEISREDATPAPAVDSAVSAETGMDTTAPARSPAEEAAGVTSGEGPRTRRGRSAASRPPTPAAPATRRLARELGVELHRVKGSGPAGRITREDVKLHVKEQMDGGGSMTPEMTSEMTPVPGLSGEPPALPDFSQWGEIERKPLAGVRRATARAMARAWQTVPHVTQFDDADISVLEAARRRHDKNRPEGSPRVTLTAVILKAVTAALKAFPQFNTSLDVASGELIFKRYYHIGVAVDTEHGLIVPVIRDVDTKPVSELARELADVAGRARERKIDLSEIRGGTFTVTNLGSIGGTAFTPIVNYPEVAILGLARSREEPTVRDGKLETRLLLPLCLSYDHRAVDGADGARFTRYLAALLEEPFRLILDL